MQKVAVRLIIGKETPYEESLNILKLTSLKERRNLLSVNFARKCVSNENTKNRFTINTKTHNMKLWKTEYFNVNHAKTVRLGKSAIINMTKQLNKQHEEMKVTFNP